MSSPTQKKLGIVPLFTPLVYAPATTTTTTTTTAAAAAAAAAVIPATALSIRCLWLSLKTVSVRRSQLLRRDLKTLPLYTSNIADKLGNSSTPMNATPAYDI